MGNLSQHHNNMLAMIGEAAPDFALIDQTGQAWRLSERKGQVIALLFYPQDETLVCTRQLCSVRDHWAEYLATGAAVIGISHGTAEAHRKFAEHHRLPLPLLVDTDNHVTQIYSHHWWMPSRLTRAVVVIDAKGVVLSRQVMCRAFRPNDDEIIAAINYAQYEREMNKFG